MAYAHDSYRQAVVTQQITAEREALLHNNNETIVDVELASRVDRALTTFADDIYLLANEPSVGLYRVYEHICHSVPAFPDRKAELHDVQSNIQGCVFDLEYATKTIQDATKCRKVFSNINCLFSEAILSTTAVDKIRVEAKSE